MSDEIYSVGYDPNPSHPTTAGADDSAAFPSQAPSKSAGDALVGTPAYDPGQSSSPATSSGDIGRTTQNVDYSLPDGKAEIYSPQRGLTGQTAK